MINGPSYGEPEEASAVESWQLLVHVCRRWRSLVFGSPRRLNLRLFCTPETPAKDTLAVWPALPRPCDTPSGSRGLIACLILPHRQAWTTSLQHLSRPTVYLESIF